jgi:hypothetical protein
MSKEIKKTTDNSSEDEKFPLPIYEKNEDIYAQGKEEPFEEEVLKGKKKIKKDPGTPGQDLDVPGAELDDADEATGGEDEENNYYSLGGEDHNDLEEDQS